MKKTIVPVIITAALTSFATIWGVSRVSDKKPILSKDTSKPPVHYVSDMGLLATQPVDFSPAAEATVPSVVHVKTMTQGKTVLAQDPFGFFGPQQYRTPDQMGSGSGVIISDDGYIVTNNHVVQGADQVQVTFNDRNTRIAKVIGSDPSTDLAVLKIEEANLPYLTLGNSDQVKLGQWVLAVGYPLNLDATVTAGIVSAKGRSLGINQRKGGRSAVESFIQTDAAVNPGNSGGALVNTKGQLVGINSAIASPTGTYAGYSYAIPSNIVQKVAADIIKFGSVQRGYLGAELVDLRQLDARGAEQFGLNSKDFDKAKGVFINRVMPQSGAEAAGLKKGDLITSVNGSPVGSAAQLIEQVARFHPGDKISLAYSRNGKMHNATVELKSGTGKTGLLAQQGAVEIWGAQLRNLNSDEAKKIGLKGGVVIAEIGERALLGQVGIKPGFVITSINDETISSVTDVQNLLTQSSGGLQIGGIYPGRRGMYYYGLNQPDDRY